PDRRSPPQPLHSDSAERISPKQTHANREAGALPLLSGPRLTGFAFRRWKERSSQRLFKHGLHFLVGRLPVAPPLRPIYGRSFRSELAKLSRLASTPVRDRSQLGQRMAVLRDENRLPLRRGIHQTRKMGLRFVETDLRLHGANDSGK